MGAPSQWTAIVGTVAACAVALPSAAGAQGGAPIDIDAGGGTTLRIERAPFRLALLDRAGREAVATVPGREGPPVRVPGIDGPQPAEPLGAAGGFPAMAFVMGANPGVTFPVSFFTGNRLFGAEAGALVSLVEVQSATRVAGGVDLAVRTDAPGAGPAALRARRLGGGGMRLELSPPSEVAPAACAQPPRVPAGRLGVAAGGGAADGRFVERGEPQPGGRTATAPAPLEDMPIYLRVRGTAASPEPGGEPPRRRPRARGRATPRAGGEAAAGARAAALWSAGSPSRSQSRAAA